MKTYSANVRTVPGSFIRVTIQAPDPYTAYQMLKAMYGNQLISDFASLVS